LCFPLFFRLCEKKKSILSSSELTTHFVEKLKKIGLELKLLRLERSTGGRSLNATYKGLECNSRVAQVHLCDTADMLAEPENERKYSKFNAELKLSIARVVT
jgi:hypothetical protein